MSVCLRSQPFCHALLKFAGYSNLLNGDILKMSNLKLFQPGVMEYQSMSLLYGRVLRDRQISVNKSDMT